MFYNTNILEILHQVCQKNEIEEDNKYRYKIEFASLFEI